MVCGIMKRTWRRDLVLFAQVFCVTFVSASTVLLVGYLALHSWRMP
jgi:hypothetical protein